MFELQKTILETSIFKKQYLAGKNRNKTLFHRDIIILSFTESSGRIMKICKKCILPENHPDSDFDQRGICSLCREYESGEGKYGYKNRAEIKRLVEKYYQELEAARRNKKGDYDCLVTLSGGKDSAYLAHKILEQGLTPLLFSIDTGFLDPVAVKNIDHILTRLKELYGKVDHIFFKNENYKSTLVKIYKYLFLDVAADPVKERSYNRSICYTCGPLMEDIFCDAAVKHGITIVIKGDSPGQPDPDTMFYELNPEKMRKSHIPSWLTEKNGFTKEDMLWFWDPSKYEDEEIPKIIAPLHVLPYDVNKVLGEVVAKKIIPSKKKSDPVKTNCKLNWATMLLDAKRHGYNPFIKEYAQLVREGRKGRTASRVLFGTFGKLIENGLYKRKEIRDVAQRLGLDDLNGNLKIPLKR